MKRPGAFLLALLTFTGAASLAARASVRPTSEGYVRGLVLPDGSSIYYGIPYAAPPIGARRWEPAQPARPWRGVLDATHPPPPCLQNSTGWNGADAAAGEESCLFLSIRAPTHAPGHRLPVIFWIHGGLNVAGNGYSTVSETSITRRGVVLVALEYRLGVFGFLGLPELAAESPEHASGNYAITDMIVALRWVKANIGSFGGDPDNITVAGQSAGAFDVGMLLLSPRARGLFQKAIMESGTPGMALPPRSRQESEAIGLQLAALMRVPRHGDVLTPLRAAPAGVLLQEGSRLHPPHQLGQTQIWQQATVDGWVLTGAPMALLLAGKQARVPLLIGNNTREFPLGAPGAGRAVIERLFGKAARPVLEVYGAAGVHMPAPDPVLGDVGTQLATDLGFRCPMNELAQLQYAAGAPVWRYQFGIAAPDAHGIVAHNAELDYVFKAPPPGATPTTWPPVQQYWVDFARSGDPNGPGLPVWPELARGQRYMAFMPDGPHPRGDLRGTVCKALGQALRVSWRVK